MSTAKRVARYARANLRARWLAAAAVLGCALALVGLPGARGVEAAAAPTITSGSPSIGAMGGGTVVTLTGTGFVAGATVTFAGAAAPVVTVVSATQIDATTPAVAPGAAVITVTNPDTQSGTLAGAFTFLAAPPTIALIAPANGSSLGGTAVTITGTDFVAGATVTIGGTAATSVLVVDPMQITLITPAHTAGAGDVVVTNPDTQAATSVGGYTFVAAAPPTATAVSPASGTTGGGTPVTVTGTGFAAGATLTFGGTAATQVVVASPTQLTARTPAHVAGAVSVVVTNADTQSATLAGGFTYVATPAPTVTAVSPSGGPLAGGTMVTVTGTGFLVGATVSLGSNAATSVTVLSSTQLTAVTPAGTAATVALSVTNSDAQKGTLASAFTYRAAPTVTAASPSSGSDAGGTVVTLSGTGFLAGATVSFGGVPGTSVTIDSASKITVTTPAHAVGAVTVTVTSADSQVGTLASGFTFRAAPTVSTVLPATGGPAGGATVTMLGSGFGTGAAVTFGDVAAAGVVVADTERLTAIVPPHAVGFVTVTVTNSDGLAGSMAAAYLYEVEGSAAATLSLLPSAGQAVISVWGGGTVDAMVELTAGAGCELTSVAANAAAGAGLVLYVPGAPSFANAPFLAVYPGGTLAQSAVYLRCA
jgi:hypothetical protein